MRKPDPTRFTGTGGRKPDELEMKGFSTTVAPDISGKQSAPPEKSATSSADTTPPPAASSEQLLPKRPNVPTNERTSERTNVRKKERVKKRHAFDIFEDQLRELQMFQLEAVRADKQKPNLGTMVREALDLYLKRKRRQSRKQKNDRKASERTYERTDQRTDQRTDLTSPGQSALLDEHGKRPGSQ